MFLRYTSKCDFYGAKLIDVKNGIFTEFSENKFEGIVSL